MFDGYLEWVRDRGDIDFLIPPDKFNCMDGELAGLAGVKVDIKGLGAFNN